MSNFHKMIMLVLKAYFKKKEPLVIWYRGYKIFSIDKFRNDPLSKLIISKTETSKLYIFVNTVLKVLSENAPVKNRYFLSWRKFWKRQFWKDHNLETSFGKK